MSDQAWPEIPELIRTGQHYMHAPIAEAVIEIRCAVPPELSLDDLVSSVDSSEFPIRDQAIEFEGRLDVSDEGIRGATTGRRLGHVFRKADGSRVVQARLNGFSFSWMQPYDRWEAFVAEAEAHWLRYREAATPVRATRLGVRFINKIDIPSAQIEIKDYLRVAVDVPAYLPQGLLSYFLQVEIPLPRRNCAATITSTLLPPSDEKSTSLVLDIDTWQAVQIDLADQTEAEGVAERMEVLREAKNYVFESCITDAVRGLIK